VVQVDALTYKREQLLELEAVPGDWPYPASLTRFGRDFMDRKQFKRFMKKIRVTNLGHRVNELLLPDEQGVEDSCWIWTATSHPKGYGRFYLGMDPDEPGRKIWAYSHRISFEHFIGIPPAGYIVDHQCNIKSCCNPHHLWPETNEENIRLANERTPYKRRNQYSVD
jgi:hypothetical protein